jgi:predicted DNA-binding transcriptional regulator AlpA
LKYFRIVAVTFHRASRIFPNVAYGPSTFQEKGYAVTSDQIVTHRGSATNKLNLPSALLTAADAAKILNLSTSWLAKARMDGMGPPYTKLGRAVRYSETSLLQWLKSRQRLSTSEQ